MPDDAGRPLASPPERAVARVRPRRLGSREELLAFVAEDPEAIEAGLSLVERNLEISTSRRAELVLSGPDGRVALVFADVSDRDGVVLDALELAASVRRAAPLLKRVFPRLRFDLPPRVLLVLPSRSRRTFARARALGLENVETFEFRGVDAAGSAGVLVERVSRGARGAERPSSAPPAPPRLVPILEELRERARDRILRLSDSIEKEPLADHGERFRLGRHVIAEVRVSGKNALEVGAGESGAMPREVFSNAELEQALSPIIRRFFALYRSEGLKPAGPSAGAAAAAPPPPPPAIARAPEPSRADLRPATLSREEIDEFYRD